LASHQPTGHREQFITIDNKRLCRLVVCGAKRWRATRDRVARFLL
jgi:hypothetical protein